MPTSRAAFGQDGNAIVVAVGVRDTPVMVWRKALKGEEWAPGSKPPAPNQQPFTVRGRLIARGVAPDKYNDAFKMIDSYGEIAPKWVLANTAGGVLDAAGIAYEYLDGRTRDRIDACIAVDDVHRQIDELPPMTDQLDEMVQESKFKPHQQLVKYVTDRPGHDRRYAIDARKLEGELGWRAEESFETGLRKTVKWYLANAAWVEVDVAAGTCT